MDVKMKLDEADCAAADNRRFTEEMFSRIKDHIPVINSLQSKS